MKIGVKQQKTTNKSFPSLICLLMSVWLLQHSLNHSFMLFCGIVYTESILTFKIPCTSDTIMLPWTRFLFINLKFLKVLRIQQIIMNLIMILHVVFSLVISTMMSLVLTWSTMMLLYSTHFLLAKVYRKLKNKL